MEDQRGTSDHRNIHLPRGRSRTRKSAEKLSTEKEMKIKSISPNAEPEFLKTKKMAFDDEDAPTFNLQKYTQLIYDGHCKKASTRKCTSNEASDDLEGSSDSQNVTLTVAKSRTSIKEKYKKRTTGLEQFMEMP